MCGAADGLDELIGSVGLLVGVRVAFVCRWQSRLRETVAAKKGPASHFLNNSDSMHQKGSAKHIFALEFLGSVRRVSHRENKVDAGKCTFPATSVAAKESVEIYSRPYVLRQNQVRRFH